MTTPSDKRGPAATSPAGRAAKASVKEAIGKLIGDDETRRRGAAEKTAGKTESSSHPDDTPSSRD